MADKAIEEHTIRAFVDPSRRARFVEALANPKKRGRELNKLDHCVVLDTRFVVPIEPPTQTATAIEALLRAKGAPDTCYLMSSSATLDGRVMDLQEALGQIVGYGQGTLISCLTGRLAYFEGEGPGDRCILERTG